MHCPDFNWSGHFFVCLAMFHIVPVYQVQRHFFFALNRKVFRSSWFAIFSHILLNSCANLCAKAEKAHKYNVYCGEARHGKAFEGLLNRYFK